MFAQIFAKHQQRGSLLYLGILWHTMCILHFYYLQYTFNGFNMFSLLISLQRQSVIEGATLLTSETSVVGVSVSGQLYLWYFDERVALLFLPELSLCYIPHGFGVVILLTSYLFLLHKNQKQQKSVDIVGISESELTGTKI